MKRIALLTAILVLGFPLVAHAWTASVSGVEITVAFTEPAVNADGSALQDLDHCLLQYSLDGAIWVDGVTVPASKATGGGAVQGKFNVPVNANQEKNVSIRGFAIDVAGNSSEASDVKVVRVDRLAPGKIQ